MGYALLLSVVSAAVTAMLINVPLKQDWLLFFFALARICLHYALCELQLLTLDTPL